MGGATSPLHSYKYHPEMQEECHNLPTFNLSTPQNTQVLTAHYPFHHAHPPRGVSRIRQTYYTIASTLLD